MQPEPIILFPATPEQTTPSFHGEGSLSHPVMEFLHGHSVDAWQPPERLEKRVGWWKSKLRRALRRSSLRV